MKDILRTVLVLLIIAFVILCYMRINRDIKSLAPVEINNSIR